MPSICKAKIRTIRSFLRSLPIVHPWHKCHPTLVITAERDSLAQEAEQYAEKLKEAGIDVTYRQFKGVPHAFTHAGDLEIAEEAWHLMSDQLKKAFE
nr:alpha/beta hydrolase fold domain-containing protein [Bacillus pumilus]